MKLTNEHLTRQLDLIPIAVLGKPITIIGAGAVGGWTCLALAKMGFQDITVWDDDVVEVENLNAQIYGPNQLGHTKVKALTDLVYQLTGVSIRSQERRYTEGALPGIVISAVDSMEARKKIWDEQCAWGIHTDAVLDPRMGAETALLYVMRPGDNADRESYGKTLYTDDAAVREPCTRKATSYCALALSGLVASQVKNLVVNAPYSRITQWQIPEGAYMGWRKTSD